MVQRGRAPAVAQHHDDRLPDQLRPDRHPERTGEPAWPKLTGDGGATLEMNPSGIKTVDVAAEHHCRFWQTIKPAS